MTSAIEHIIEADIDRGRRLGDPPDRNIIDPALGNRTDRVEPHPARRLGRDPPGDQRDRRLQHRRRHIVEQQPLGAGPDRRFDLVEPIDLDLDQQSGVIRFGGAYRGGNPARDGNMIILDAWSTAGILGPVIVNYLHDTRLEAGVPFDKIYAPIFVVFVFAGRWICC